MAVICLTVLTFIAFFINFEFQATVKEDKTGVIVNLTVEDRDDPSTGAWRAIYTIINGNPGQSFEIHTNPENNQGMLSVVKVRGMSKGAICLPSIVFLLSSVLNFHAYQFVKICSQILFAVMPT